MRGKARSTPEPLTLEASGTGHTLLCLHGLGGGAHWFQGLALRLRNRYRVVSLDLPGTGANRTDDTPFSIDRCVEALGDLVTKRETGPMTLLGHSLGAILALRMQAELPGRLHSLIFVGGLPSVTAATRKRLAQRRRKILRSGMAGIGWKAAEGVFSRTSLRHHPETAALYARLLESYQPEAYMEGIVSLLEARAEYALQQATVPCLVMTGSEDAYAPPVETRKFADSLPGPVRGIELKGCGHLPFLETPDLFCREIMDFMDSIREGRTLKQEEPDIRMQVSVGGSREFRRELFLRGAGDFSRLNYT